MRVSKYIVEVRMWVRQKIGREHELEFRDAEALVVRLRDKGVAKDDIRIEIDKGE